MFFPELNTVNSGLEELLFKWLQRFLVNGPRRGQFEIEAKLGYLVDKTTGNRVCLPVCSETILSDDGSWYRFESNIPTALHKHFNLLLNEQVSRRKLTYKHTKTVDILYKGLDSKNKARKTVDETDKLIECIEKRRISDIAIFFPNAPFDIRISINEEIPITPSQLSGSPLFERRKDRVSYTSPLGMQLDLTQVKQSGETKHELEIEVIDATSMVGSPQATRSFIDTIRNVINATSI